MASLRNDSDVPLWVEGLRATNGDPLVLDEAIGTTVFVRHADPGDDTSQRVRLDPGQDLGIATPIGCIAICMSDQPGADDAIYWMRVVPDRRGDGVVYGRTLRPGESDDGRRVHVRPGERFELPEGSVQITLDEIEQFYRDVDPERPSGSMAAVVRVWHSTRAIEPPELARTAQAAAHRLDAAVHLLERGRAIGRTLREEDTGGPRLVATIDEYLHLVQEGIVALARCVALLDHARNLAGFPVSMQAEIERHRGTLKDLRDAYEHIDERALGRSRGSTDDRNLMIFDHSSLVRDGVIAYFDHELRVEELHEVIAACRSALKEAIGGPPQPSS